MAFDLRYTAVACGPQEVGCAEEAPPRPAPGPAAGRCRRAGALAACAGAAAAAAAALGHAWSSGVVYWHAGEVSAAQAKHSLLPSFPSQCGATEENQEYVVEGGWYMSLDHIPDSEMCCAMCQGVPQCNYFTWVADAGLEGCKSQCWLKGGNMSYKQAKRGLVSGVSPPRPRLPARLAARTSAPPSGNERSLFCFSLMVPHSYEKGLLSWQQERSTSIFGCDAWAVYSNVSIVVAPGVVTHVVQTDLSVKFGGDSYTALNSWIFIAVWKKVIDERWHKSHKWLVKVDPDAVFFPERLRPVVRAHEGVGYINNCKYGLHGPIEVLSAQALSTLEADYNASFDGKAPKECVERLHFGQWGEDFFLSRCLWKIHQVSRVTVPGLMCEAHCDCPDWYWCNDAERVTFHPFKRVDMYSQCMANSMAAPGAAAAPAAAHMVAQ